MDESSSDTTAKPIAKPTRNWKLIFAYTGVALLVLITCISVATRLAIRYVDAHPEVVQSWLAKHWQAQVHIGDMSMSSDAKTMTLEVKDFVAKDAREATFAAAKRMYVVVNWRQSLQHFRLIADKVIVEQPVLQVVHHRDGHFSLGKTIQFGETPSDGRLSRWFLRQKNIEMTDASVSLYSEKFFETWQVAHANLHVGHNAAQHFMTLDAPSVGASQGKLALKMQWQGDLTRTWSGGLSIEGKHLPLDMLGKVAINTHTNVQKSLVDIDGQMRWQDNVLEAAQAQLSVHDMIVYNRHTLQTIHLPTFPVSIEGFSQYGAVHANLHAEFPAYAQVPAARIEAQASLNDATIKVSLPEFTINQLGYFLPWFANQAVQTQFVSMQPEGVLQDAVISIPLHAEEQITAHLRLDQVALAASKTTPGVSAFDAEVQWSGDTVHIGLQSEAFMMDFGEQFRAPLQLGDVVASVRAQFNETGWELSSEQINITPPFGDIRASVRMHSVPDKPRPFIELSGKFQAHALDTLKKYLPTQRLNPSFVRWFDQAFDQGQVTDGEITLHGDLNKYPFKEKSDGVFSVQLQVKDASLKFHRDWQALKAMDARLEIHQRSLTVNAKNAHLGGMKITDAKFWIDDLKQKPPILHVEGGVQGKATQLHRFLSRSPLKKQIGKTLKALAVTGPVQGNLALDIFPKLVEGKPILPRVRGHVVLQDNQLTVQPLALKMTQVNGLVHFTERQIEAMGLTGQALGGPVLLNMTTEQVLSKKTGLVRLTAKGRAQSKALKQWAKFPLPTLQGSMGWQGTIQLARRNSQAKIRADLTQAKLEVPDVVNKPVGKKMPLVLDANWDSAQTHIGLTVGKWLKSKLNKKHTATQWTGGLAVRRTLKQNAHNLLISAKLKTLQLTAWQNWLDTRLKQAKTRTPMQLDVIADTVVLGQSRYQQVKAKAKRTAKHWEITAVSKELSGKIKLPHVASQPVSIALNVYRAQKAKTKPQQRSAGDFLQRPINLKVGTVFLDNASIGSLRAKLRPNALGVALKDIVLQDKDMQVQGAGQWHRAQKKTLLNMQVKSSGLQRVLAKFSYTGAIEKAPLQTALALHWPGTPADFALGALNGTADIAIGAGVLEDIDASSGKVFGLMGLHTLGRRFRLDWKDLEKKGLDFNSVKGKFTLRNGVASTKEVRLHSSTVHITFAGNTNLHTRAMHFNVDLRPRISDTLPAVGAVTAGLPGAIVGGALAVIDKITNHGVDKTARKKYRLTGSWKSPKVTQIKRKVIHKDAEKGPEDIFD